MIRSIATGLLLTTTSLIGLSADAGVAVGVGFGGVRIGGVSVRHYGGFRTVPPQSYVRTRHVYRSPVIVRQPVVVPKTVVLEKRVLIDQPRRVCTTDTPPKRPPVYESVVCPSTTPPVAPTVVDCCEPKHCYALPCPGESLDAICLREYGDASLWTHVVEYNKITGPLCVDTPIFLPNIHSNGKLTPSTAPAPASQGGAAAQQAMQGPPVAPL